MAKDIPTNDMKALAKIIEDWVSTRPYDKALTYEVVEKSEKGLETDLIP